MWSNEISKFILDTIEDMVYIADTDTYELYYVNGAVTRALGIAHEGQWHRQKCYQILQGRTEPCEFCTNPYLQHDQFYNWEHYNPLMDCHFYIQDKLIHFDGIDARFEIAKNITDIKKLEQEVAKKYREQKVLNECVGTLHSTRTPDESINQLLQIIANYHSAERGYIFELNKDKTIVNNTHEWCLAGVEAQIDNLQNIDAAVVDHWFEKYETVGEFYIDALDDEVVPGSREYEILHDQGISSLVTAPIRDKRGIIIGFIGVDNPKQNIKETGVIKAVTTFVADFFDKNELVNKLHKLSYYDSLTQLKNRHSYSLALKAIQRGEKTSLGVVYVDVNGLKYINDKLGHQLGDQCIKMVGHAVRAVFTGFTYRIGGDEFVALCKGGSQADFMAKIKILEGKLNVNSQVRASIGYVWQDDSQNVIRQIEQADGEMYAAKKRYYKDKRTTEDGSFTPQELEDIKQTLLQAQTQAGSAKL